MIWLAMVRMLGSYRRCYADGAVDAGAASSGGYFQPRQAQDARAYTHPAGNYYRPTADANTTGRRQPHPDAGAYHMQTAPFPATNSSHYPAALPAQGLSVAYNMTTSPDPMNMNQFETESFVGQGVHGPNAPAKRQRANAASFDDADDADDEDREMNRLRPQGACARCKGLKVKCEFRADTDVCKRCLNAGQPCQIPGRKKRRTPPSVLGSRLASIHILKSIPESASTCSIRFASRQT
ncbi:uncharacterized protein SCHCODRAFT_02577799 [Schizophyllum commune H4-8]|uniref:uncharacterized protein n=1 Tax=Schizophyllum commune (strain H4-8 / FGSC 9210) TaxID=578458 RepID=UPI00216047A0|nr:uncharacterized protein SCHCODRAFT_02577799 [Schizophyllum commune H4-8]KAI5892024.1 hypothetical protein SCHCODRAFT_02577799 [Schizophyllum commune H4-8]